DRKLLVKKILLNRGIQPAISFLSVLKELRIAVFIYITDKLRLLSVIFEVSGNKRIPFRNLIRKIGIGLERIQKTIVIISFAFELFGFSIKGNSKIKGKMTEAQLISK